MHTKSKLCVVLIALFICLPLSAQELPPIENFTPIDYGAENQNWGITQTTQKNIYTANNGGILEFNGAIWKLYGSPNGSTIRSVKAINDIVYSGCYMEFGFWKKNEFDELEYNSISSELASPLLEDEEFWNIIGLKDFVLFQSLERIYIYNTTSKTINIVAASSKKAHIFKYNDTVYYHSTGKGLFKIENGKSILVSDDSRIKEIAVLGIFSIESKPLLVTENGSFYFLENENLLPWNVIFKANETPINVYSSLQLADESIVLGTISNGIYHISKKGELLQKINKQKGLNNNTVLSIFEDTELNLWLALDNGISVINIDSPFKEYVDENGELGMVYASASHNDNLYLGTNQGLFYKKLKEDIGFSLVSGTEGQVWLLKIIDGGLFCGHNKGTFLVAEDNAKLISDFAGTWELKRIPKRENLLLQGNFKGLSVLEKTDGEWGLRNIIEGFDISSRFFEFIGDNQLVVNREFKGVFKLSLDKEYTKVVEVETENSKGVGASMVRYLDQVLYTCSNGIFRYDSDKKEFVSDTMLTKLFYKDNDNPVGIFISDNTKNRLWCFTGSTISYAIPGKFNTDLEVNKIAIPSYVRKNFGVLGFENLTPFNQERYLIGISNGYLTLDLNKSTSKKHLVFINSVSRKSKTTEQQKINSEEQQVFDFDQNNLYFSYNVPQYDKYSEVNFQYKLAGIYNSWSSWQSTSSVSFENLPYGDYSFKVRAKIGNKFSDNVASYNFEILRPWYLSNLMIFTYILGLCFVVILVHRLYKNYYQKEQKQLLKENRKKLKRKKLKSAKELALLKNEKLKGEIESKNRELAISTMSIIKRNEFLNSIKDKLVKAENSTQIKSVIKTIDRNLNTDDDWKFFEEAFNNADKNFLKKIKEAHPKLTPNDLRLCAYLRLNLTSKEIAPLLNISLRSVEVKRYRLRKKMNLSHESGLTAYLMEL